MSDITITRAVRMPDLFRIERSLSNPKLGPRLLFFSGGSALNGVSQTLKRYTHNSIHLVTPFDSGGSSQGLRVAFDMPAIGDLRSRLMALADETVLGHPEVFRLFTHRFSKSAGQANLADELDSMIAGAHILVSAIEQPMRTLIQNQLGVFRAACPPSFDLRGASIGNLILAGGYLNQSQELEPIIFLVSKLVGVQGIVRAVTDDNLHLGAELANGRTIIGQHLLTGKEHAPLTSPVKEFFLNAGLADKQPAFSTFPERNRSLMQSADLMCYSPGSFYTSLVANLLPKGVGQAISKRTVPKVFVPSIGSDPETAGMGLSDKVNTLLSYLRRDAGADCPVDRLLNFVLVDHNAEPDDFPELRELGLTILKLDLVTDQSAPYYDPVSLCEALISLT
ncbi:GAK system CofD-like protein [Roseibium denhamense]|uniref:CofD-related protein, GAK system n=1 Tax=Roseibium denhamense TaxID=76305 RepID=A0ABY1NIP3_9HYPH|nr:GAK system CofD-like protein [Roseibium denhamense]MTI05030.1 GAK system CofD-like protein [Roseibium denhamense]SMP09884.1 CofD-related protein, GAK system [Roseibium denhamense]